MGLGSQSFLLFLLCFHLLSGEVHCAKHHFVLVHGFGGGGWGFYKVKTLLDRAGHNTSCPDLRSGGIDPTPIDSVNSFDQFNEPLIQLLSRIPNNQTVVLAGTSAGGVSLTDAIHKFPKKIKAAVFISATMLRRGFLTEDDKQIGIPGKPDNKTIPTSDAYNKTSAEDMTLAMLLTKPGVGQNEIITNAKFPESPGVDEVRRIYVKTTHDEVLLPWQQEKMIAKWRPFEVYSLASDHNAVWAASYGVYDLLIKVADMA